MFLAEHHRMERLKLKFEQLAQGTLSSMTPSPPKSHLVYGTQQSRRMSHLSLCAESVDEAIDQV